MKKIAFLMWRFNLASGAHRTVINLSEYFNSIGIESHIYTDNTRDLMNSVEKKQRLEHIFQSKINSKIYAGWDLKEDYDMVIATNFLALGFIKHLDSKKAFFIQDFSQWFFQRSIHGLYAEKAYSYDIPSITIGQYLSEELYRMYERPRRYINLTADKNIYFRNHKKKENAICFFYQPDKPKRCSLLGIEALRIVKEKLPDIKIYIFGSEDKTKIDLDCENLRILSIKELNDLYNKCKVGICLSSTNPSRIPFEMMASGLPVVELDLPNNIYDFPECVTKSSINPKELADDIIKLILDEKRLGEISDESVEYMSDKDSILEFEQFAECLHDIYNNEPIRVLDNGYDFAKVILDDMHIEKDQTALINAELLKQIYAEVSNDTKS